MDTEAELDGQYRTQFDMNGITRRIVTIPSSLKATNPKHRPRIEVGKDVDDYDGDLL